MITAANVVFGMKRNVLVKNPSANMISAPFAIPLRVVRTLNKKLILNKNIKRQIIEYSANKKLMQTRWHY